MATQKPKSASKAKPVTKNTSAAAAAAPGNNADVLATEAAKAVSQAIAPQAGQTSNDEAKSIPPAGAKKSDEVVAKALVVSAKADGFRRSGRRWTVEAQTVDIDEFSADQVEALLAEPMLDVVVVAE